MFSCCYNILKTYVAPPPANRMEKTRHKPPFCPRKQVTHILVKRKRQVLYYENCSSKISVCTSGSERNLHQLSGMNTRLKRGYTVVFQTPPLAKAKKKKKYTWCSNRTVQKRATSQSSTEGKIHPSLEATGMNGTSPTESHLT